MGNSVGIAHRNRNLPHQQRQQHQLKPQSSQGQEQRMHYNQRLRDGFDEEWKDRDVEVEQVKGTNVNIVRGRVVDVGKYWLKMLVNGEIMYINKAFILLIKPLMIKETGGGRNGGEQPSRSK